MERFARIRRRPSVDSPDAPHRIFAAALDALFLADPEGRVSAWSPGAERMFGRPSGEILGRPAAAIAGGAWAERLPFLIRSVAGGEPFRHEEILGSRADGAELSVDLLLSAMRDGDGGVSAIVGVARETSERRRREDSLRDREGRLVEVARFTTAGEILDGLGHEMSQPLTSISNFAGACEMLLRSLPSAPAENVRSYLRQIVEQATKAGEILKRARRFARRSEEPVAFELADLARESLALLGHEMTKRKVRVELRAETPVTVLADVRQIEQVIVNLLRNAGESFGPDAADRRILVEVRAEGAEASVAIHDNGAGIRGEVDLVGEPFRSSKRDGLGLGLGICRTILDRHHGRLHIAPRSGGGTTARFVLPLHPRRGTDG